MALPQTRVQARYLGKKGSIPIYGVECGIPLQSDSRLIARYLAKDEALPVYGVKPCQIVKEERYRGRYVGHQDGQPIYGVGCCSPDSVSGSSSSSSSGSENICCRTWRTEYWHMSDIQVSVGETLTMGDVLGLMGDIGSTFGAHLHYAVTINNITIDFEKVHVYEQQGSRHPGTEPYEPPPELCAQGWARTHIPLYPLVPIGQVEFVEHLGNPDHDAENYYARDIFADNETDGYEVRNIADAILTKVIQVDEELGKVVLEHYCEESMSASSSSSSSAGFFSSSSSSGSVSDDCAEDCPPRVEVISAVMDWCNGTSDFCDPPTPCNDLAQWTPPPPQILTPASTGLCFVGANCAYEGETETGTAWIGCELNNDYTFHNVFTFCMEITPRTDEDICDFLMLLTMGGTVSGPVGQPPYGGGWLLEGTVSGRRTTTTPIPYIGCCDLYNRTFILPAFEQSNTHDYCYVCGGEARIRFLR